MFNMRGLSFFMRRLGSVGTIAAFFLFSACEERQADLIVEKLPPVKANLPAVPKLPPPPYPAKYEDGAYSLDGLMRQKRNTLDTEVYVKAYVVDVYIPEPCEGDECKAYMPYVMIADDPGEKRKKKLVMLTGYATAYREVEEARNNPGGNTEPHPASGVIIPTDLDVGAEIRVKARFTNYSKLGNKNSRGLLDYLEHETLQPAAAEG